MDLYAYSQIQSIDEIAKKNNIYCPRLRGYRLMKDEEPVADEFWKSEKHMARIVEDLCMSIPFWTDNAAWHEYSERTDMLKDYYVQGDEKDKKIRWDRIHGWKRRALKTAIHNDSARYKRQYDTWNKYAGEEGILYIHARIGGNNWKSYYQEVVNEPWFIEKVDDASDSTYCDIYASVEV